MQRLRRRSFDDSGFDPASVATDEDIEQGACCRICFDGNRASPLIAPCGCSGSSKWVHVECIRRWQRSCTELRAAYVCSVCTAPFNLSPPHGLAPLLERGCLLVASPGQQGPLAKSVVLLCAIDGTSAHGLVLNQPCGDEDVAEGSSPRAVRGGQTRSCKLVQRAQRARRSSASETAEPPATVTADAPQPSLHLEHIQYYVQVAAEALLEEAQALVRPCARRGEAEEEFSFSEFLTHAADGPWPLRTEWRLGGPTRGSGLLRTSKISALHTVPDTAGGQVVGLATARGHAVAPRPVRLEMQGQRPAAWKAAELPGHVAQLAAAAQQHGCTARLILFVGNVEWSRQSLDDEIAAGQWGVCPARTADLISDAPLEELWPEARLRCQGQGGRRSTGGVLRGAPAA